MGNPVQRRVKSGKLVPTWLRGFGNLVSAPAARPVLAIVLSACVTIPPDPRDALVEFFPFGLTEDCTNSVPLVEKITENGVYALWKSTPTTPDADRFVVVNSDGGCNLVVPVAQNDYDLPPSLFRSSEIIADPPFDGIEKVPYEILLSKDGPPPATPDQIALCLRGVSANSTQNCTPEIREWVADRNLKLRIVPTETISSLSATLWLLGEHVFWREEKFR